MPVTFPVNDVKVGELVTRDIGSFPELMQYTDKIKPEAYGAVQGQSGGRFLMPYANHGFLNAIHVAFDRHLPLALSPDHVWLTIAQGFAKHVELNAEALRKHFVQHEGKVAIVISRDGFVKGAPTNDWVGCFQEFSDRIAEYIGKKRDLLVSNFSTTSFIERAASEIVLMDCMKQYFSYGVKTACGFPSITLLGKEDDWRSVRERAQTLAEFQCETWIEALVPVLDQFVAAFQGSADPKFWASLYKDQGGSGGPFVTGFVNVFFPYLKASRSKFRTNAMSHRAQVGLEYFPGGWSSVPFDWDYHGNQLSMQFLGGFAGAVQDPDEGLVTPAIGWAVADAAAAPNE